MKIPGEGFPSDQFEVTSQGDEAAEQVPAQPEDDYDEDPGLYFELDSGRM